MFVSKVIPPARAVHRRLGEIILLSLIAAGCAVPAAGPAQQAQSQQPAAPKRAVMGLFSDPPGIFKELTNPGGSSGSVPGLAQTWQLMSAGLTYQDDDDVTQPWLAQTLPTAENGLWKISSDGRMEMTWKLRSGIAWHDGTPLSIDDLQFTFDVDRDSGLGIVVPSGFRSIDGIDRVDDQTFVVRWKVPFIEADTLFSAGFGMPLPAHLLRQTYLEDKANLFNLPYWREAFVGVGAFKLQEWTAGSYAILVANDKYVLGRPKLDQIELRFITEQNTLIANFQSGAIDLPLGARLILEQVIAIKDTMPDGKFAMGTRLGNVLPMYPQFMNPDPPLLANLQFRRALLMSLDRKELADTFGYGLAAPADSWLQPDRPAYPAVQGRLARYQYDPRGAAQMIESLGFVKGPDGFFRDSQGQKLGFLVRTTDQLPIQPKSTLSVANYWQQFGLDVRTENVPNQLIPDRAYRAQFPAFELVSTGVNEKSGSISFYKTEQIPLPENNFVGGNRAHYSNPDLDALIDRYLSAIPFTDRWAILGDILHVQTDQLTMLPLFFQGTATVLGSKRLLNVTGGGSWNAHLWDVQ